MSKKSAFIISSFNDIGTGASYEARSIEKIGEGEYGNYEAAGLVREPTDAELKTAEKDAVPAAPSAGSNSAPAKPAKAAAKA